MTQRQGLLWYSWTVKLKFDLDTPSLHHSMESKKKGVNAEALTKQSKRKRGTMKLEHLFASRFLTLQNVCPNHPSNLAYRWHPYNKLAKRQEMTKMYGSSYNSYYSGTRFLFNGCVIEQQDLKEKENSIPLLINRILAYRRQRWQWCSFLPTPQVFFVVAQMESSNKAG